MGVLLTDNFSILHFAIGIVFYYLGLSLYKSTIIHIIFEIAENTPLVMNVTNKTGWWPGGKPKPDNYLNMFGDTIYFILGWIIAKYIDEMYEPDNQVRGSLI